MTDPILTTPVLRADLDLLRTDLDRMVTRLTFRFALMLIALVIAVVWFGIWP